MFSFFKGVVDLNKLALMYFVSCFFVLVLSSLHQEDVHHVSLDIVHLHLFLAGFPFSLSVQWSIR